MSTAVQPVPVTTAEAPLSVLVIDTCRQLRAMMARAVTSSSLPIAVVHQVADGQAALALMRREHIDVVVCTPDMPVLDAEHFIAAVRADASLTGICVVVASAAAEPSRSERLRALGARIVHKPFGHEELEQAVRQTEQRGSTPPASEGTIPCAP